MENKPRTHDSSTKLAPDSIIDLAHGDPTMFKPFWMGAGEKATVVFEGWQALSYFSDTNICWFLEPELATQVQRIHRIVGNAVTDSHHIIVGVGSTQLIHASLFALSSTEDQSQPLNIVCAAPYYSMYPGICDLLKSPLFRWAGDTSTFKGEDFIELVSSPSYLDGPRDAVLNTASGKRIHDMTYYWPHYTPMHDPADHDIMLFSMSKATGHAGSRVGWALVKDTDVAKKMVKFIELNSLGAARDSQLRAARILNVVSDGYELPAPLGAGKLFHFGRRLLADRWRKLRCAVEASRKFSLPQFSPQLCKFTEEHVEDYPGFAWLRCEEESIEDCECFFKSMKVLTRSGMLFGAGPEYVRISMVDSDDNFDMFIERISSLHLVP